MRSPFNSPRLKSETPYWLRNGAHERAEAERDEATHRRLLGMGKPPHCETCRCGHLAPCPEDPAGRTE